MSKSSANIFVRAGRASRARRGLAFAATAGLAVGLSLLASPASALLSGGGAFQLDGNADTANGLTATALDDWDKVCYEYQVTHGVAAATAANSCGIGVSTTSTSAVAWAYDGAQNATIFTGGGSKDPIGIASWKWKDEAGGLPDKDNLQHAFAARYTTDTTDILTFGSDRFDNSGDAVQGFWFFQNKITLDSATGKFVGVHKTGDLLVLSDFSNGGGTSTINVYKWVGSDATGVLEKLNGSASASCTNQSSDPFCGIVNPDNGTVAPWNFTDKSGNSTYLNGEFYEGGINLKDGSINLSGQCFASFASETRSSTSITATLKDFVLGGFGNCGSTTVTTPKLADGTTNIPTPISIGTAGSVTVRDSALVTATGASGIIPTGTVDFFICGPLATGTCDASTDGTNSTIDRVGTPIGTRTITAGNPATVVSDVTTVTSAGRYCFRAVYSGDLAKSIDGSSDSRETECFVVNPVQPNLSTTAGPSVLLGNPVTDTANLSGTANKPGSPVINPTTEGLAAGGTITFSLYGPSTTTDACGPHFGTVATDPVVTVSGDGTTYGSGTVSRTPTAVGTYHWKAVYTGDSPNTLGVTHNADCRDTGEDVVVSSVPSSLLTAQSFIPNDSATISATAGGNLVGDVSFQVFETNNCTGTALHSQTVHITSGNPAGTTVNTTNTTHSTTSANVSWLVGYDSTNPAQDDIAATCVEKTTLTIDNG